VSSGNKYTYTLRCIGPKGFVSHHNQGKSITFFEAPVIASVSSTATGNKISWNAVNGAVKYRVYYINDKGLWQGLGNTTATSYEHKNLTAGKTYTYTVRVLNYSGTAVSDFDRQGTSAVFYMPPVISSLSNTANGVSVTWDGINGVSTYRLYRKTNGSAWVHIGDVNGTSYVDTNVSSGNKYTYTTRCMNSQGKLVSTHNQGKSITFYGAPVIQKIVNDNTSATITWGAVNGAAKYRVYYVNASGKWEGLGNTTTTSYRHQNLKDGTTYTYTVRVLNTSGTAVSDFDRVGTSTTFFNPPEITAVTKVGTGYMVQWDAREGVAGYRLFRRSVGSSWETVIANTTSTFYIDASTKSDVVYTYTIRYLDSKGNYISGYLNETKYYYNGELANGTINVNGTDCYFNNGLFRSGYQKIGGNDYYYGANGAIMKNGIVGSDKDGWRYADSTGKIDYTCCNGVTQHGYKWIVINGMARKVVTDSDLTLFYAAKEVAKVTKPTMTKQQKLKACFDYCKVAYAEFNPRIPHYKGMDWPIVYANDMFVGTGGNCLSYGAAFAYMAKAIGYTEVYACHSGGHGWAEIDGLIYDPEWSKHRFYHSYFALSYDEIYDQNYKGAIAAGLPWMHVKI
ncbi:MAG: hypothetical protein II225_01265, partial [Ruminococcus sp.]|nr:hypothetical protein [Ruminococcus sp.]